MKFTIFRLFLAVLLLNPNYAVSEEFYTGIDVGSLSFDQKFLSNIENYGIILGYSWDNWALEGVVNFNDTVNDQISDGSEQTVNMYHLYEVYRTSGRYYFKVKAGLTNERYLIEDNEGKEIFDDVHSGIARGVGLGFSIYVFHTDQEGQYAIGANNFDGALNPRLFGLLRTGNEGDNR